MPGGDGATFRTRADAIAKVNELRANGARSIDVGCMQVNLAYHGDAFASLEEAFDPVMNVACAARFLANLKEERGSWNAAVAAYHSSTPKFGIPYRQMVAKTWHGLRGAISQDRIQAHRAAVAAAYQKRKAEFEAHQARVIEAQKAKHEARRQEKAKAQGQSAVEEVRGDTTHQAGATDGAQQTMPERIAMGDETAASPRPASFRCEAPSTAVTLGGQATLRCDARPADHVGQHIGCAR